MNDFREKFFFKLFAGLRFGVMQSKLGIASIIKHFNLTISPKNEPVELDPYAFLLTTVDKMYLNLKKIN